MDYPRLVVIGAGALSSRRIYPYLGAAGARLVGVCDLDPAKAERNTLLFGGTAYTALDQMLDEQRPDGVIICVGPEAHAQLAPAVLRRGYPVYTEKPPAVTAAQALVTARAAKETGLLCVTAFKKRYNRAYTRAKELLNELPLRALSLDYASADYQEDSPRTQFLLDFAIHGIDLVCYLGGEVAELSCFARDKQAYAVAMRFTSGAVGSLSLTTGRSFGVPTEEVELTLDGGCWMTVHNSSVWRVAREGKVVEQREPPTFTSAGDDGYDTGHLAELVDFVEAVKEGRTGSRSSIFESYKSMVVYEAIREAAETGRGVGVRYEEVAG